MALRNMIPETSILVLGRTGVKLLYLVTLNRIYNKCKILIVNEVKNI